MNKKIIAILVLITILFASSIAGTLFYFNGVVNSENSKISSLKGEITNQNSQLSNLTAQVTNLTTVNLVASVGINEILSNPYNYLNITGSVNNTGEATAYNAGLLVVAYTATGTLEINMTFPLDTGEIFGADAAINSWISSYYYGYYALSLPLGDLGGGLTTPIDLGIYHEGTVTNWTITPVWTNSP